MMTYARLYALAPLLLLFLCCIPAGAVNNLQVKCLAGVFDGDGVTPLQGGGFINPPSDIVQLIYAGPNGAIQPPNAAGLPTGDDQLVGITVIGEGFPFNPNEGKFTDDFSHNLSTGSSVYVRAWNSSSIGEGIAYGDSALYAITNLPGENHIFGSWTTDQVIQSFEGMPLTESRTLGLLGALLLAAAVYRLRHLVEQ